MQTQALAVCSDRRRRWTLNSNPDVTVSHSSQGKRSLSAETKIHVKKTCTVEYYRFFFRLFSTLEFRNLTACMTLTPASFTRPWKTALMLTLSTRKIESLQQVEGRPPATHILLFLYDKIHLPTINLMFDVSSCEPFAASMLRPSRDVTLRDGVQQYPVVSAAVRELGRAITADRHGCERQALRI